MLNLSPKLKAFLFCGSLLSFSFFTPGYGDEIANKNTFCSYAQPLIEAKAGYFFFSGSQMRDVYKHGGWDVQLSSSYPVWSPMEKLDFNVYGAVEYFQCQGRSLQGNQSTTLWAIPVNLGLKTSLVIKPKVQYYFTLGPRYFYIHQHNNSSYVDRNKSRNGVGLFVNTGCNFILSNHFLIDLFGEYSYATTHFHTKKQNVYTRNIQISGFTFGGGLGYAF